MRRLLFFTVIASLLLGMTSAQVSGDASYHLRAMEWNVENLFDTVHDEGFLDEAFLPQGQYQWTSSRYWRKLDELSKVIAAVADEGGVPDFIGLCEVENDSVLTTLSRRSALRGLGYDYVITQCEDARGIDVALLYQPMRFRLLASQSFRVPSREQGLRPTRDILYAKGLTIVGDSATGEMYLDTLHVLVAHLPSRVGGHASDQNRKLAAATLWNVVDSLMTYTTTARGAQPRVMVMGDFNADASDRIFRETPLQLTDERSAQGTYCFRGLWQWLDHILVSSSIGIVAPARPVRLPWLLEADKSYDGEMPRRTFRGPTYHGGISDHLPIILDFR